MDLYLSISIYRHTHTNKLCWTRISVWHKLTRNKMEGRREREGEREGEREREGEGERERERERGAASET